MELTQIKVCGNCNHPILRPVTHWVNYCPVCGHPFTDFQDQATDPTREAIEKLIYKLRGEVSGPAKK